MERCDVFSSKWVFDNTSYLLYIESDCPYMSNQLACHKHGRPDFGYHYWRWQPHGCNLKRCGPCQIMVPVLNEVSALLEDKIQVVKIDTEKYSSIADKYRIEALPTFIIFKNGEPCDRFEGALTAKQLIERIETTLEVKQ